jgi:hypothetical protein
MFKQNVYLCHSERCAKERSDQARVEEPREFFFYSYRIREFSQYSITNFGNDYGPLLALAAPLWISSNFVPILASILLLFDWRYRLSPYLSIVAAFIPADF